MCFLTKDAIGGGNKGGKVTTLLLACFEIVALLLGLLGPEDFLRKLGVVGLGIEVNNGDINDAVSGRRVDTTKEKISTILWTLGNNWRRWRSSRVGVRRGLWSCWSRGWGKDHGLTADTAGGSGFDVEGAKSVGDLIMASVDEASDFAGHGMVYREWFVAAITLGRKV